MTTSSVRTSKEPARKQNTQWISIDRLVIVPPNDGGPVQITGKLLLSNTSDNDWFGFWIEGILLAPDGSVLGTLFSFDLICLYPLETVMKPGSQLEVGFTGKQYDGISPMIGSTCTLKLVASAYRSLRVESKPVSLIGPLPMSASFEPMALGDVADFLGGRLKVQDEDKTSRETRFIQLACFVQSWKAASIEVVIDFRNPGGKSVARFTKFNKRVPEYFPEQMGLGEIPTTKQLLALTKGASAVVELSALILDSRNSATCEVRVI
jgi:hypothetical protein